jgi:hypothetical protein
MAGQSYPIRYGIIKGVLGTGIAIKESGIYGKGARFEILVPQGKYRFLGTNEPG